MLSVLMLSVLMSMLSYLMMGSSFLGSGYFMAMSYLLMFSIYTLDKLRTSLQAAKNTQMYTFFRPLQYSLINFSTGITE